MDDHTPPPGRWPVGYAQCNESMLWQLCPDWQWNGECHIAIMGKGERERENKRGREEKYTALQQGSKIPQSVLAEQIETITVRGIFSFGIFFPLPLHLICHEVHECSDQSERGHNSHCQIMSGCLLPLGSVLVLWTTRVKKTMTDDKMSTYNNNNSSQNSY